MKRVFIIHGWGGVGGEGWQAWLKVELEKKGFQVFTPDMPDTENPKIETWVPLLAKLVGTCNQETFFVGHSVGCQTILRYLADLPAGEKAGGAVFVAGWLTLQGLDFQEEKIAAPWLRLPLDFKKIRSKTKNFFALFSDNDPYVPMEDEKLFQEKLGAETLLFKNKGHFTEEPNLPIVLKKILAMSNNF